MILNNTIKGVISAGKVIVAIGIIGGAAIWLDNIGEGQDDIMESIEMVSIEQQFMAEDIMNINDSLIKLNEGQSRQGANIESLEWAINNLDNFTPEQLEEILNRELKKNTSMQKIYPDWPQWMTAQPNTDLARSN